MVSSVPFVLLEKDILKTILEYLELRGLHITQVIKLSLKVQFLCESPCKPM